MSIVEEDRIMEDSTFDNIVKSDKETTIVFCVFGENITTDFFRAWSELFGFCLKNNIKPILSTTNIKSNIFTAKLTCLLGEPVNNLPFQGKIDYDYVVWLNSGCSFSIDNFKALINSDKNIVSALSTSGSSLKNVNFIETINTDKEDWNKESKYTSIEDLTIHKKHTNILKVDYVDSNFMLIKKSIYEQLSYPWYQMNSKSGDISGDMEFMLSCKSKNLDVFVMLDNVIGLERQMVI